MLASDDIWNFTINGEKKPLQVLGGYIKMGPGLDITTSFICMDNTQFGAFSPLFCNRD